MIEKKCPNSFVDELGHLIVIHSGIKIRLVQTVLG